MTDTTIHTMTARGIKSTGREGARGFSISSVIYEGIKPAIGRRVEIGLGPADIAFMLATLAEHYPQVIKAAAGAISEDDERYGVPDTRPGACDQWAFARHRNMSEAVRRALQDEGSS